MKTTLKVIALIWLLVIGLFTICPSKDASAAFATPLLSIASTFSYDRQDETTTTYDGSVVLQERDGNNNPLVTYTRGLDMGGGIGGLLARTDAKDTVFYHSDAGGNVTALVDRYQTLDARYLYDPFGNLLNAWGPLADVNTYRFSSKEVDPNSGLYYFGERFYDPNLQRFINRDPSGENGGINLYAYTGNNPVNFVDPDGLSWFSDFGDFEQRMEDKFKNFFLGSPCDYHLDPNSIQYLSNSAGFGVTPLAVQNGIITETPQDAVLQAVGTVFEAVNPFGDMEAMGEAEIEATVAEDADIAEDVEGAEGDLSAVENALQTTTSLTEDAEKLEGTAAESVPTENPLFQPGPYAGESIPAQSTAQTFTQAERDSINEIGYDTGCHTCGTTDPGTVSGNFVPDHQPVSALNTANAPQQLYPQCINCSRQQGLAVARALRARQQ